jgi:hypothetical protein
MTVLCQQETWAAVCTQFLHGLTRWNCWIKFWPRILDFCTRFYRIVGSGLSAGGTARMIDVGIAVVGAIFYFTGQFGLALVLILLAIISGAGAVVRSIANPDWYFQKRMQAGLDVDVFNSGKSFRSLIVTKAIVIAILIWAAWHIATKAGYI